MIRLGGLELNIQWWNDRIRQVGIQYLVVGMIRIRQIGIQYSVQIRLIRIQYSIVGMIRLYRLESNI
jgi:hypothetical protein